MIVLEQHIDINVYHQNRLQRFDVVEILTDDGNLSFKVMKENRYYFTLVGTNENNSFRLLLSDADNETDGSIDRELLSKIKVSLYSIFLNEMPS